MKKNEVKVDKKLAAVCGIYCPSCTVYIGTTEDPQRLEWIANRLGVDIEDVKCLGCRSEKLGSHCLNCYFKTCAEEKGLDFCGLCDEYPCKKLKEFQAQMPHRAELWDSHKQIKDEGFEKWFHEQAEHYACKSCETLNSAYDLACYKCGENPSNKFAELHGEKVVKHMKKVKA